MSSFKDTSIQRKLQVVITGSAIAALLVSCLAFLSYDLLVFRSSMRRDVAILAAVIGSNCRAALTFNDPKAARDILEGLKAQPRIVAAGIYSGDGKLFAQYARAPGQGEIPAVAQKTEQALFGPNRLRLFHRIILDGEPIGTVYVESDLEEMRARTASYLVCVALILAGCALLAFLLSARLQRVISSPLLRLAATAQVVSLGKDYSLRAAKESQDEIGHLIDSFNEMLGQIQLRDQELNRHREHLEEEVAKRTAALRRSEMHFRQLFSTIPLPVLVYDNQSGEFLEVNDTAVAHYGYTLNEFLKMRISDIQLPEESPGPAGNRIQRKPSGQYSEKHRTKQGKVIEVDLGSHSIEFGGREATLTAVQDLTDRKRMEVELRHAQKLEAVGRLAAGIAHEINTPIQFVGDNTRLLQECFAGIQGLIRKYEKLEEAVAAGTTDSSLLQEIRQARETADLEYAEGEIPRALEQTLEGVDRVTTIVRAMKEFAHPDLKEKTAADINKALLSTLTVARNELKYVAEVQTDLGELPPVMCNISDLNQVFLNILVNAAHAIADVVKGTTEKGLIQVRTKHEDGAVLIAISDTGCGIPQDVRTRIFDPFFTTKEVGRGTGQGLAIARSIVVEKHRGTLTFESELGKGSTFFIRLPLEKEVGPKHDVEK